MNHSFPSSHAAFVKCIDCHATLGRLIGNLSGFLYRRRPDPRWTMEFVSSGCRDLTGYDPHRFIGNASLAFADLIARSDWKRINERTRVAVLLRQRTTIEYLMRTAQGTWLPVEDRLTPVVNAAGKLLAIEGVIDRARCGLGAAPSAFSMPDEARLSALCRSPSSN